MGKKHLKNNYIVQMSYIFYNAYLRVVFCSFKLNVVLYCFKQANKQKEETMKAIHTKYFVTENGQIHAFYVENQVSTTGNKPEQ